MTEKDWTPWADIAVRSAGMPFHELLALSDAETVALALESGSPELLNASWNRGIRRSVEQLLSMAESGEFRAALLWQNPNASEHVGAWLRRHFLDTGRNQARRHKEATLTRYAQRYHARNETIGFFGPSAWTRFADDVDGIAARPGPRVVSRRAVYFEDWVIDGVGAALTRDPRIRRLLPPNRVPGVTVRGALAVRSDGSPCRLASLEAAVLAHVDGRRLGRDIMVELRWRRPPVTASEDEVFEALERLVERDLILWRPDVPLDRWPERALRHRMEALPDSRGRSAALEALEELDAARDRVLAAADRPVPLAEALAHLDGLVEELTGAKAVHTKQQRRFGRRAVYSESPRDIDLRLGRTVRDALLPPLSLLLDSARWLVWRLGERMEELIEDLYKQLTSKTSGDVVPLGILLHQFLERIAHPLWPDPVLAEFQRNWKEILAWDPNARRVRRSGADIAAAVATVFSAPPPKWYGAAQHSPDIMIAAAGADAVASGSFELVLGELHLAMATLDNYTLALTHPDRDRLLAEAERGLADRPRVVPAYFRSPKVSGRDYPVPELFSDRYWYLSLAPGNGERALPQGRVLRLSDLVAERAGTSIVVPLPTGERLPVLDVIAELAQERLVNLFRLVPASPHTPRITVDDLVIVREKWRVPAAEIPAGPVRDEPAAFAALRRWAENRGMPRFVFWRTSAGTKPIYLDFDAPLLVNDFLGMVRRAQREDGFIEICEMRPDPDELWLPDAEGRRYTSELRLVFTDGSVH